MIKDKQFPRINYIGNKEKIAPWICKKFPKEVRSVFDSFSGGCSISYELKKRGFQVITNDILKINALISRAIIVNDKITLDQNDVDKIRAGKPKKGFMYHNYSNVHFFERECMELDQYKANIFKYLKGFKKDLAMVLLRRSMIRKMPYSRFNIRWSKIVQLRDEHYSYEKYKRKRAYHNQSFLDHMQSNVNLYNNAVFSSGLKHKSYNQDVFYLAPRIQADLIYIDPPYSGTMNNYFGFYGLLDELICEKKLRSFNNNFTDKKEIELNLDKLFSKLLNYKYCAISYNNRAYPTKEKIIKILKKYTSKIEVFEKQHNYQITGKTQKTTNIEYLFLGKVK